MTRVLFIIGGALLALSLVLFVTGLSSQSPVGFAGALLCGVPLSAFFLGGAVFSLFSRYRIIPRDEPMRVPNGRRKLAAQEPLN